MVVEERPKPSFPEGFTLVRMHFATTNQLSNTNPLGGHGPARASIVLGNDSSGRGRRKPVFRAWHASSSMAGHSANTTPAQSVPFVSNALSTSYHDSAQEGCS